MEWKPYTQFQKKQVVQFLEEEEPVSISCATRILESQKLSLISRKPEHGDSLYLGTEDGKIHALVYCRSFGIAHPVFRSSRLKNDNGSLVVDDSSLPGKDSSLPFAGERELEAAIRRSEASGIAGRSADVRLLEALCPLPRERIQYRYMVGNAVPNERSCSLGTVREACAGDFEELLLVEEAYQKEEVLSAIHDFSMSVCSASVRLSLARYKVFVLEIGGRIIARAQINGTGRHYEQIGGVFVWPEFRGRGAGWAVTAALAEDIRNRGKTPALFVKTSNKAATQLYKNLGFIDYDDFVINYF